MKSLTIVILFLLLVFTSHKSIAGESSGAVEFIMLQLDDIVIFSVGEHAGKPECSAEGEEWALSLKTESGKAIYAALLSAAAQGKNVRVFGKNDCDVMSDRESLLWIAVEY